MKFHKLDLSLNFIKIKRIRRFLFLCIFTIAALYSQSAGALPAQDDVQHGPSPLTSDTEAEAFIGKQDGTTEACSGPWIFDADSCYQSHAKFPCPPATFNQVQRPDRLPCRRREFGVARREPSEWNTKPDIVQLKGWWPVYAYDYNLAQLDLRYLHSHPPRLPDHEYIAHLGPNWNLHVGNEVRALQRIWDEHHRRRKEIWADCQGKAAAFVNNHRAANLERLEGLSCACGGEHFSVHFGGKNSFIDYTANVQCERIIYHERRRNPDCPLDPAAPWIDRLSEPKTRTACRCKKFGLESTNVCGKPGELVITSPGLTKLGAHQASSSKGYAEFFAPANQRPTTPICATCTDMPWRTGAEAKAKFMCVEKSINVVVQSPITSFQEETDSKNLLHLVKQFLAQLQRIYENQPEGTISPESVYNYYLSPLFYDDACPNPLGPESGTCLTASPCEGLRLSESLLKLCGRSRPEKLTSQNIARNLAFCLSEARTTLFAAHSTPEQRLKMAQAAQRHAHAAAGSLVAFPIAATAEGKPTTTALETIARWYAYAKPLAKSDDEVSALLTTLRTNLEAFWRNALPKSRYISPNATTEEVVLAAASHAQQAPELFIQSLQLAKEGLTLPLPSDPDFVAMILVEVNKAVERRVEDMAVLHDLGCRFLDGACQGQRDDLAQLNGALARLTDPEALRTFMQASAPAQATTDAATRAVLDLFSAALLAQPSGQASARRLAHEETAAIRRTAASAIRREARFVETGFYVFGNDRVLASSMHASKREAVLDHLLKLRQRFERRLESFFNLQSQSLTLVAYGSGIESQQVNLGTRTSAVLHEGKTLNKKLAYLRQDLAQLSRQRGERDLAAKDLSRRSNRNGVLSLVETQTLSIDAQSARGRAEAHGSQSLPDLAVGDGSRLWTRPWKFKASAGDRVTISASGRWAPTCALQRKNFTNPNKLSEHVTLDLAHALTGPEGFTVRWSDNKMVAESTDHTSGTGSYEDQAQVNSDCESQGYSLTQTFGAGGSYKCVASSLTGSLSFSKTSSQCSVNTKGERSDTRTSTSQGQSRSGTSSADFVQGTRINTAPFANLPVGSLILVEVPRDHLLVAQATRIQVVTGSATLSMAEDSDVYLVVNDITDPSCQVDSSSALTVHAVHQRPKSGDVAAGLAALSRLTQTWSAQPPATLAAGAFGSSTVERLYATALHETQAAMAGRDASPDFTGFAVALVRHELDMLSTQAAIQEALLGLEKNEADAKNLALEAQAFTEQRMRNSLASSWVEAGIDNEIMRDDLTSLVSGINHHLWPLVQFRHPKAFYPAGGDLDSGIAADARDLTAVSLSDTLLGTPGKSTPSKAQVVLRLVNRAIELLEEASSPGDTISGDPYGGNERRLPILTITLPRPGHTPPTDRSSVDPGRASQFWQALVDPNRAVAEIAVDLRDIYNRFDAAGLKRRELAPFIHRMAIYAHLDNQRQAADVNDGLRVELRASATTLVPTHRGPVMYRLGEELRSFSSVPLMFGKKHFSAAMVLDKCGAGLGARGLSPFTTFEIETEFINDPKIARELPYIQAFSLVFQVDFQKSNDEPAWLMQLLK